MQITRASGVVVKDVCVQLMCWYNYKEVKGSNLADGKKENLFYSTVYWHCNDAFQCYDLYRDGLNWFR